jgi:hypothetical protein
MTNCIIFFEQPIRIYLAMICWYFTAELCQNSNNTKTTRSKQYQHNKKKNEQYFENL